MPFEPPPPPPRRRALGTAVVALLAGAVGATSVLALDALRGDEPVRRAAESGLTSGATTSNNLALTTRVTDFSKIYGSRAEGVVAILAGADADDPGTSSDDFPFGPQRRGASQGSGVVVDTDGHILTNEHVVSGATSVRVTFAGGSSLDAEVVGTDPSTDLALLRVDAPDGSLTVVPLGDSDALRIGEAVMAVGSPFGYQGSASAGIVSGLGRSITSPNGFSVPDAIQTDAAVNRGNSGGALLNSAGDLVGVPTQIADSGVPGNVGVAFAVPSSTAKRVIGELKTDGRVDHAWLGVSTASVDETLRGLDGVGSERGAMITGLARGGPAERAGLRFGDTIVESIAGPACTGGDIITVVNGSPVGDAAELQRAINAAGSGDRIELTVVDADGNERSVGVTLLERPASAPATVVGCGG